MERPRLESYSRRTLVRAALAAVVAALLLPAAFAAATPDAVDLGPGLVQEPADQHTYVSVQGFHYAGYGNAKKPARLAAADGDAEVAWHFDGDEVGASWFYEVDPLENGTLLVTSTYPEGDVAREMGGTLIFEFDPGSREPVWTYDLPGVVDTHSTAMLSDDRLLVANMRAYDGEVSHDRLLVVGPVRGGEVEREREWNGERAWEWVFHEHFDNDSAGGFREDWTHVNDVDVIEGPDPADAERYVLTSPRNFDQAVVLDRETGEIAMRLGWGGDHGTLFHQHNPDYLERDDGTPVLLVADSGNDRVVEYERDCGDADPGLGAGTPPEACEWSLAWAVDGFSWPRDADRLPNGNTLVTDTLNHRVVEITPEGEVVWEFYAAWAPYEAERGAPGSDGPTMADRGTTGSYTVSGGGEAGPAARYQVADAIADLGGVVGQPDRFDWLATRWAHHEPWFRPTWMGSWTFLSTVLGLATAVSWGVGEAVVHRRRIVDGVRHCLGRISNGVSRPTRRRR